MSWPGERCQHAAYPPLCRCVSAPHCCDSRSEGAHRGEIPLPFGRARRLAVAGLPSHPCPCAGPRRGRARRVPAFPRPRRCPRETFPADPVACRRGAAGLGGRGASERRPCQPGHLHDPAHERLPRPARLRRGSNPGSGPGCDGRQRHPVGRRCRRTSSSSMPATRCRGACFRTSATGRATGQGNADHRDLQRDGLQRGDLRQPRVRLGPGEPGQPDHRGHVPVRHGEHRQEGHRGLLGGRLGQAGLRRRPLPDPHGRDRPEHGQGRLHRRDHDRDADDHRLDGDGRPVLQGWARRVPAQPRPRRCPREDVSTDRGAARCGRPAWRPRAVRRSTRGLAACEANCHRRRPVRGRRDAAGPHGAVRGARRHADVQGPDGRWRHGRQRHGPGVPAQHRCRLVHAGHRCLSGGGRLNEQHVLPVR